MTEFNYERKELEKLSTGVIVKVKLIDDAGNETHWMSLMSETLAAISEALIKQGGVREDLCDCRTDKHQKGGPGCFYYFSMGG